MIHSHGRRGADNMANLANTAHLTVEDLLTPTVKPAVYTTGRGGRGNMIHNVEAQGTPTPEQEPRPGLQHKKKRSSGRWIVNLIHKPKDASTPPLADGLVTAVADIRTRLSASSKIPEGLELYKLRADYLEKEQASLGKEGEDLKKEGEDLKKEDEDLKKLQFVSLELRQRHLLPQSDLRAESLTREQLKEQLSDYFIMRLEKVNEETVDDLGNRVGPTWQNCIRRDVYDMSKDQAARKVRELDLTTKSVSEKKASFIPAQQRQIEKLHDELIASERDPKYQYALVQLDRQLEKIKEDTCTASYDRHERQQLAVSRMSSKDGRKNRQQYRQQPITAFFKRMPREGEDLILMLQQLQSNIYAEEGYSPSTGSFDNEYPR